MEHVLKISQQTLWQVAAKIVSSIATLIVLGIITRNYGPSGTGVFTLALAYLAFFYLAADLGLNSFVLPRLNDHFEEANELFSARFFWSLALIILANVLAFFLPMGNNLFSKVVLVGSLSIVFSGIFNSTNLIFQKKLRYDQSAIASSVGALFNIPIALFLVTIKSPVDFLLLIITLGWVINNVISLYLVKKIYKLTLSWPKFDYILKTIKISWPLSLTLLLNVVYFRIDAFILSFYYSFAQVGVYNLAYQLFQAALVLPTFVMNGFYPIMVETLKNHLRKFKEQILIGSVVMFILAVLGTLLTFVLAPIIIKLVSGDDFQASITPLRILSLGFPAFFVSSVLMWTFVTLRKYKKMLIIYIVGLIINLTLNLIFIPKYSYIAAAWVTNLSEYLILILQIAILYKEFKD